MSDTPKRARDATPARREVCGAKTRDGGLCAKWAMDNGRCSMHVGKAAKGIASGRWRHGRRSRALERLNEAIADRVDDPELTNPKRSMAAIEGALATLHELAEVGDGPEFRENALARLDESLEALDEDETEGLQRLHDLRRYLREGVDQGRAAMGVASVGERLNRAQLGYWTTAMKATGALSPDEFGAFLAALAHIMEGEVGRAATRRVLERVDREHCKGALGMSRGA